MTKSLILIQCKDEVGLVAVITKVLAVHNLNITAMREFVDESTGQFFARMECNGTEVQELKLQTELKNILPERAEVTVNPKAHKCIAVLVTKEYQCLGDILIRDCFN